MLSGYQGLGFVRLGRLVEFLQRLIHLLRHWGTGITPRSALLRLDHDNDDVAGVLVRREGSKPDGMADHLLARHYLGRPRFAANSQTGHGGFLARSFPVLHVAEHGFADNVEAAFADVQLAADPAGRESDWGLVRKRVLGFG